MEKSNRNKKRKLGNWNKHVSNQRNVEQSSFVLRSREERNRGGGISGASTERERAGGTRNFRGSEEKEKGVVNGHAMTGSG